MRSTSNGPRIITHDTTIHGNYSIPIGAGLIIQNGATLTVTGDLTIDGALSCAQGKLSLVVQGKLHINNSIECILPDSNTDISGISIAIVAKHVEFGTQSTLDTNGHIDVVSSAEKLILATDKRKKLYDEVQSTLGDTSRVGPFIERNEVQKISAFDTREISSTDTIDPNLPNLIIRGTWHIGDGGQMQSGIVLPAPPKATEDILIRLDYGDTGTINLEQFHLFGPSGHDGQDDIGISCDAHGKKGGNAFRFLANAKYITLNEFTLKLGDGGNGGNATTKNDCALARAIAGDGGSAGNLKISATKKIYIMNFHLLPGKGGNGGNANAFGKNGDNICPGSNGGNAEAIGGNGNTNKKDLTFSGAIFGLGQLIVGRIEGGSGGSAIAQPGHGGKGNGCNCAGGKGGDGSATGGLGAQADGAIPSGTIEAHGGDGGDVSATGGDGGDGGNCQMKPTGGAGGDGGDAKVTIGKGGKGRTANGYDGTIKNASGGIGGNGGDGCGPGNGGAGGIGNPLGTNGTNGKISCAPGETFEGAPAPTTVPVTPKKIPLIKAILFHGKYLPVDQIIITNEAGCDSEHWRAENGSVRATDGTTVIDPAGAPCGYGKLIENPIIMVPAQPYFVN